MLRRLRQWLTPKRWRTPCFPILLFCLVTANMLLMGMKTLTMISMADQQQMDQGETLYITEEQTAQRRVLKFSSAELENKTVENSDSNDVNVHSFGQEMLGLEALQRYKVALSKGLPRLRGIYREEKGFLTIGIPSVPRPSITYLYQTIDSIINSTTPDEQQIVTIVIYLGSFNQTEIQTTLTELAERYNTELQNGLIHVVRALSDTYPSLNIRKRNYRDSLERIKWRSKQVVDYAYLFTYAQNISDYYLHLEDDVTCANHFISAIRSYIKTVREYWITLHFSDLGYIGKLHRSSELNSLATYFMLFYYEEPVDFLLPDYENVRHQQNRFLRKPTLFQHMGRKSSHKGLENKLIDVYYESVAVRRMADNPPANLFTDIRVFQRHVIANAYQGAGKFFWGVAPRSGNFLIIVFDQPIKLYRALIHTGSPRVSNDFLRYGILEAAPALAGKEEDKSRGACDRHAYVKIGEMQNTVVDTRNSTKNLNFETKCLKLTVTRSQSSWVIIRGISIFTHDVDSI